MPFIAQGETNWKFILILVIFAAIIGGGILAYQYWWWLPEQETKGEETKGEEPKGEEPKEPYIEVISPNGGETWTLGESYNIQWVSWGIKNVNILLVDYRAPETCYLNGVAKEDLICEGTELPYSCEPRPVDATEGIFRIDNLSQVRCRPGMHQWPVADISPGDEYKIRIEDADVPSIADFSDNYFSIVEVEPTPVPENPDIDPAITEALEEQSEVPVIISVKKQSTLGATDIDKVLATLASDDFNLGYRWNNLWMFSGSLSSSGLDKLSKNSDVALVQLDVVVPPVDETCEDSDGGVNYYVRGFTNPCHCTEPPCPTCGAWIDKCLDENTLLEYSCDNLNGEQYVCPNGCEDGACLPVGGGPCSYQTTEGKCDITSIEDGSSISIKFRFSPIAALNLTGTFLEDNPEAIDNILNGTQEEYVRYLSIKCLDDLNKYPLEMQDLENCDIRVDGVYDCEMSVISQGTCTPIIFRFTGI